MTTRDPNSILDRLDELKTRFDQRASDDLEKTLARLARLKFANAETLVRYHELLLFIRAYPHNSQMVALVEKELASFHLRVENLQAVEPDLAHMETPEVSGIAGTSVTDTFSYPIVRWLVRHQPGRVTLDWDWFEDENRLAATWPRFMPLLAEDASVEANVPYSSWLRAARGRETELSWLVRQFEALPQTESEKTELYDSQKLYVRWTPPYQASRTGMRLSRSKVFYQREPLIQRRDISLSDELEKPAPPFELLSFKRGQAILDLAREASTVRYRELYGFTHGDPHKVLKASFGRGVEVFIAGLPPNRRLPLRAYHAAMIFKNGIAVGYFEGLSLFERMESGFNLYYTFREGETAWLYAKTLNVFRHLAGVTAFVLDPYQIGFENEEGIESGAFWFYRKLGFRSVKPEIMELTSREEQRMNSQSDYRTTPATLRKLAAGPMIFELDQSLRGDWDEFQLRNIGLRAQERMAARFKGDPKRMREDAGKFVSHLTGIDIRKRPDPEVTTFEDFAVALSLIPALNKWQSADRQQLRQIILAKRDADEADYLKRMQRHGRLRKAFISLGVESPSVWRAVRE